MNAVDTSVAVAAFAGWHEGHERAIAVMAPGVRLPAHCAFECYPVLTRLPPPHRLRPGSPFLSASLSEPLLSLDPADHLSVLSRLAAQPSPVAPPTTAWWLSRRRALAPGSSAGIAAARVYQALGIDSEVIA